MRYKSSLILFLFIGLASTTILSSQTAQEIGDAASSDTPSPKATATPAPEDTEIARLTAATDFAYLPFSSKPPIHNSTEQAVLDIVNSERNSAGCGPLTGNILLAAAARNHNQDMIDNDFFSHTGSDGSNPDTRITRTGYGYSTWGENIAAGYNNPTSVMTGWMNSDGHRANILNCNFTEIGISYLYDSNSDYGHYWVQVFGRPN